MHTVFLQHTFTYTQSDCGTVEQLKLVKYQRRISTSGHLVRECCRDRMLHVVTMTETNCTKLLIIVMLQKYWNVYDQLLDLALFESLGLLENTVHILTCLVQKRLTSWLHSFLPDKQHLQLMSSFLWTSSSQPLAIDHQALSVAYGTSRLSRCCFTYVLCKCDLLNRALCSRGQW